MADAASFWTHASSSGERIVHRLDVFPATALLNLATAFHTEAMAGTPAAIQPIGIGLLPSEALGR